MFGEHSATEVHPNKRLNQTELCGPVRITKDVAFILLMVYMERERCKAEKVVKKQWLNLSE